MSEWYANPFVWMGAVATLVTVLVIVGRLVFLFGQWKGKVDEAQSTFRTTLDKFMAEIRADMTEFRAEMTEFRADMAEFRADMAEVRADIKRIFERLGPATATRGSPVRLTDLGKSIADRLDAGAIADGLVPQLRQRVAGKHPYEIQELCISYVEEEYEPPDDVNALVLQCAFDEGIDRKQVLRVVAIELRDRLLPNPPDRSPSPSREQ